MKNTFLHCKYDDCNVEFGCIVRGEPVYCITCPYEGKSLCIGKKKDKEQHPESVEIIKTEACINCFRKHNK